VSAMYERGFVHHAGFFPMLEAQMTSYIPGDSKSPDRMDALVHAISTVLVARQIQRASVVSAAQRRI
jgi:phage terminase large subunit-like protein